MIWCETSAMVLVSTVHESVKDPKYYWEVCIIDDEIHTTCNIHFGTLTTIHCDPKVVDMIYWWK